MLFKRKYIVYGKTLVFCAVAFGIAAFLLYAVWPFGAGNSFVDAMRILPQSNSPKVVSGSATIVSSTEAGKYIQFNAPILMYHHVGILPEDADSIRRDLTVSADDFKNQLTWLHDNGYNSVSLEQIYLASQGLFAIPAKPVAFSFDDGYADVFELAVPLLRQYGFVGSFAVVPGFVGSSEYATWEQITAARQAGMEIVSHTLNHFDGSNPKYSSEFIRQNLDSSLKELDARLGTVPRVLVYPYGHYTAEYIAQAKQAGFLMALTVAFGTRVDSENLMETPRVRVHGNQAMEKFIEHLSY